MCIMTSFLLVNMFCSSCPSVDSTLQSVGTTGCRPACILGFWHITRSKLENMAEFWLLSSNSHTITHTSCHPSDIVCCVHILQLVLGWPCSCLQQVQLRSCSIARISRSCSRDPVCSRWDCKSRKKQIKLVNFSSGGLLSCRDVPTAVALRPSAS